MLCGGRQVISKILDCWLFEWFICIQNLMRKKEVAPKASKGKLGTSTVKKTSSKAKPRVKDNKPQQCFILVGDQFYVASSKTQRKTYQLFEEKMKTVNPTNSIISNHSTNASPQSIDLRQYVKSLSKAQKQQLYEDLERQIEVEKEPEASVQQSEQTEEKLSKLKAKLEHIRSELMQDWEQQIARVNYHFDNEQISLEEKNEKIRLVEKMRNYKLAMIHQAQLLFENIMKQDYQLEINNQEQLEHIINCLNPASSMSQLSGQEHFTEVSQTPFDTYLPQIQSNRSLEEQNREPIKQRERKTQPAYKHEIQGYQEEEIYDIKKDKQKDDPVRFSREHLRLDIRLDEVQFGRDHYEEDANKPQIEAALEVDTILQKDIIRFNQQILQRQPINIQQTAEEPLQQKPKEVSLIEDQGQTISSNIQRKKLEEEFLCVDEQSPDSKIQIPLLMTKDRLEQLQLQKSSRQIEALNLALKNRHGYQVSEIQPDTPDHFTTLLDINNFIVSFYEFVMQCFLKQTIEGLNLAYGKSALDKLFQIRNEGYVPDYDNNNILPQQFLVQYHREVTLSHRKIPEFQKLHNKAIFDAFNAGLNVYRPYYELEGEVFPWNTSQKGLTFYEISDDNIQQVFEKSKMRVLEYCASLCGIMPNCELTTHQSIKMLHKRNDDSYERILKSEVNEKFGDWYLKILNFQALARLNLCEQIIEQELQLAVLDIKHIHA